MIRGERRSGEEEICLISARSCNKTGQLKMAVMVAQGLSQLLKLKIEVNDGQQPNAAQKPLPTLDLDCIHKYSLHWVSSDGSVKTTLTGYAKPQTLNAQNRAASNAQEANVKPEDSGEIKITVKTLTGKATILRAKPDISVSMLKHMIQLADGVDSDQQKLLYHNKKLEDEKPLSHYGVAGDATIFMIVAVKQQLGEFQLVPSTFLDPGYDYNYSASDGNTVFSRGNRTFIRPCGWIKKALLVLNKYENNVWLGTSGRRSQSLSVGGEWPVSYHGTKKTAVEAICKQNGSLRLKGKYFVQGKGIFTTPSPILAEEQTDAFEFEGCKYKMIFMDRVNMDYTAEYQVPGRPGHTYLITSNENSVRPYCILFKKV